MLVAIAETGSLSAAADARGVAQPNASRVLGRLERRLGTRLLDRGARGSQPTSTGTVAIDHARRVLDAAVLLVAEVERADGRGAIRIMASQTIAEHLMPTFLAALSAGDAQAPVHFEVGNSTDVVRALRRGAVDMGFVEGTDVPAGITSLEVARDRLVAVVAPNHPWAQRRSVTAAELAATALVVREAGSGTRDVLARALADLDPVTPALELHSNGAVRTAVAGGAGPAVLSELAVAEAVADGRLHEIPVEDMDLPRSLRAVWIGARSARLDGALDALRSRSGSSPR
jgi:DNA-binding transcriptional LysR family regulator